MQQITRVTGEGAGAVERSAARAVERISQQGMAGGREVDADLMGAPRRDPHVAQECSFAPLEHPDLAVGRPAGGRSAVDRSQ
jgi:hypothetical protein